MEWKKELPLAAMDGGQEGKLVYCDLGRAVALILIDIRSPRIPEIYPARSVATGDDRSYLTINYGMRGRCELKMRNGSFAYLTGGELSIDIGQAVHKNSEFFYPSGAYYGLEIFVRPGSVFEREYTIGGERITVPDELMSTYKHRKTSTIAQPDDLVRESLTHLEEAVVNEQSRKLLQVGVLRFLLALHNEPLHEEGRRAFFTRSQVAIAKATLGLISNDLGVRYSAAELAQRFGVSETSLKNYFSGVYGCGYSEYQNSMRMQRAAELMASSGVKVGEVANAVGFANQSRFAKAFRAYHGVAPLEYRRMQNVQG